MLACEQPLHEENHTQLAKHHGDNEEDLAGQNGMRQLSCMTLAEKQSALPEALMQSYVDGNELSQCDNRRSRNEPVVLSKGMELDLESRRQRDDGEHQRQDGRNPDYARPIRRGHGRDAVRRGHRAGASAVSLLLLLPLRLPHSRTPVLHTGTTHDGKKG